MTKPPSVRCEATTQAGTPCRRWAMRGSDPPRCSAHDDGKQHGGRPKGWGEPLKHGLYLRVAPVRPVDPAEADLPPLKRLMLDLVAKHARLSAYIDMHLAKEELPAIAHLFELHARTAWRLGWVMQQYRLLNPDELQEESDRLFNEMYDELGRRLGIPGQI